MAVYSPIETDKVARYQAKKLARGDDAAFAKSCGEYARNDVFRSLNETIIENAHRDRKRGVRFARVTTGNETCLFCLMLASRGAVYKTRKTAGEFKSFHRGCDCKVVPGFEKDPLAELVEGHNPKAECRIWKRVSDARKSSQVVFRDGFDNSAEERKRLEMMLDEAWSRYKASGGNAEAYRSEYVSAVKSACGSDLVDLEDFSKIEAKELQEAIWLAKAGHMVEFRNPEFHRILDGNTSDALVDGRLCDFKKIESSSLKKMVRRVTEKLDHQGPTFLVDITESKIRRDEAEIRLARLLDDQRIESLFVLDKGEIEILSK